MFAARIEIVVVHQPPLAENALHIYAMFGAVSRAVSKSEPRLNAHLMWTARGTFCRPSRADRSTRATGRLLKPRPALLTKPLQRGSEIQNADLDDESMGDEFGRAPARRFDGATLSLPTPPRA